MDPKHEAQLFEALAQQQPRLKEWLQTELSKKIEVLVKVLDADQMRRTQGYAQCLQSVLDRLDKAVAHRR